jgi:hypothetical protein
MTGRGFFVHVQIQTALMVRHQILFSVSSNNVTKNTQ